MPSSYDYITMVHNHDNIYNLYFEYNRQNAKPLIETSSDFISTADVMKKFKSSKCVRKSIDIYDAFERITQQLIDMNTELDKIILEREQIKQSRLEALSKCTYLEQQLSDSNKRHTSIFDQLIKDIKGISAKKDILALIHQARDKLQGQEFSYDSLLSQVKTPAGTSLDKNTFTTSMTELINKPEFKKVISDYHSKNTFNFSGLDLYSVADSVLPKLEQHSVVYVNIEFGALQSLSTLSVNDIAYYIQHINDSIITNSSTILVNRCYHRDNLIDWLRKSFSSTTSTSFNSLPASPERLIIQQLLSRVLVPLGKLGMTDGDFIRRHVEHYNDFSKSYFFYIPTDLILNQYSPLTSMKNSMKKFVGVVLDNDGFFSHIHDCSSISVIEYHLLALRLPAFECCVSNHRFNDDDSFKHFVIDFINSKIEDKVAAKDKPAKDRGDGFPDDGSSFGALFSASTTEDLKSFVKSYGFTTLGFKSIKEAFPKSTLKSYPDVHSNGIAFQPRVFKHRSSKNRKDNPVVFTDNRSILGFVRLQVKTSSTKKEVCLPYRFDFNPKSPGLDDNYPSLTFTEHGSYYNSSDKVVFLNTFPMQIPSKTYTKFVSEMKDSEAVKYSINPTAFVIDPVTFSPRPASPSDKGRQFNIVAKSSHEVVLNLATIRINKHTESKTDGEQTFYNMMKTQPVFKDMSADSNLKYLKDGAISDGRAEDMVLTGVHSDDCNSLSVRSYVEDYLNLVVDYFRGSTKGVSNVHTHKNNPCIDGILGHVFDEKFSLKTGELHTFIDLLTDLSKQVIVRQTSLEKVLKVFASLSEKHDVRSCFTKSDSTVRFKDDKVKWEGSAKSDPLTSAVLNPTYVHLEPGQVVDSYEKDLIDWFKPVLEKAIKDNEEYFLHKVSK